MPAPTLPFATAIGFAAPQRLWFLAAAGGLAAAYAVVQIRRKRAAATFANPELLPLLTPQRTGWWRHAVALVFALGLVAATVGAAQPTMAGTVEEEHATVIVAIDTSDSMMATDVAPSRLAAAVASAKAFIADLPSTFEVGLVTANSAPAVIVAPTTDHLAVGAALDKLETRPGTALGEAIFTALSAIPTEARATAAAGRSAGTEGRAGTEETVTDDAPTALIVLLSDGKTTTGRPDADAIAAAVEAGVPVSTIAFGTDNASVVSQGITVDVPVDSTALEAIAEGTEGTFFQAATAAQLKDVYQQIDANVTYVDGERDIAEWFAAVALVLLVVAALVSMLTTARVVWT